MPEPSRTDSTEPCGHDRFERGPGCGPNLKMFAKANLVYWAAGLFVAVVAAMALKRYFSPEASERRRERSHGKVVSRRRGPRVKLAVKTEKSKSEGRG